MVPVNYPEQDRPGTSSDLDAYLEGVFSELWELKLLSDERAPFRHVVSALVTEVDCSLEEARSCVSLARSTGEAVVVVATRLDAEAMASGLRRARVKTSLSPAQWSHQLEA
jgi:ATP-dependent Clp protease adapter protein ClpS